MASVTGVEEEEGHMKPINRPTADVEGEEGEAILSAPETRRSIPGEPGDVGEGGAGPKEYARAFPLPLSTEPRCSANVDADAEAGGARPDPRVRRLPSARQDGDERYGGNAAMV